DVAFKLPKGSHSAVIDTPESIYLMLVEDIRPAHVRPLSEVREEIEKTLIGQEQTRLRKKWADKLKAKAFVRYYF
ncbi:MAG: peptidyl-prolyl cis-trans isomerase, partial [Pedosphaera parvula]|nr:peptidyl-prolyl cis-trans isomerase [Pedosphaera parvula]